jgi:hypothetical protein
MSWNIVPNCHVQLIQGATYGTATGTLTYNSTAQLLTPKTLILGPLWEHRLAVPATAVSNNAATVIGDGATVWSIVNFVDDVNSKNYTWYQITDVSFSTAPAGGGQYTIDAIFLSLESCTAI